jgi:hypothetical protein
METRTITSKKPSSEIITTEFDTNSDGKIDARIIITNTYDL